jgi:prevent-host-death family protein
VISVGGVVAERIATVSVLDARKNLADLLNRTAYGDARICIARHGKPVAALISIEDLKLLEALEDQADLELVERIERESTPDDYVRWEDVRDQL